MKPKLLLLLVIFPLFANAQNLVPVKDENGLWGYEDNGNTVIKPQFDAAYYFQEDLAGVKKAGRFGYINKYGEIVIPYKYDEIQSFSNGYAAVKFNGKWGYIDKSGKLVMPYKYDDAVFFSEGLAAVKLGYKWGYIDVANDSLVIPFKYDNAKQYVQGLSAVRINGKNGFIDKYEKWYDSKDEFIPLFSDYAKSMIEEQVNTWQKKGKYEKTADWQKRVNDYTRKELISKLTKSAEISYIQENGKKVSLIQRLQDYDADNEVFLIKDETFGDLLVPVPIDNAPNFEKSFYNLKRAVTYFINNDKLDLAEIIFTDQSGKKFKYSNEASLDFFITNIDYKFAPIELDSTQIIRYDKFGSQNIQYANLTTGSSDVDMDIPKTKKINNNTFVVIIANEAYKHEDRVPFAKADGESFQKYCIQTLGIPEDHISFCSDATLNEMRMELSWLRDVGAAYGQEAKILVYYSGHGVPSEESGQSYLLPVDGSAKNVETGFELSKLYHLLGELPVSSVTVFLDACFSGEKREGGMMLAAKGAVVRHKDPVTPVNGKLVVFSASQNDQTALIYDEKCHGLFTYFLLKKLQESKGSVTLGELADYIKKNVKQKSIVTHKKSQDPSVTYSPYIGESWSSIKLL